MGVPLSPPLCVEQRELVQGHRALKSKVGPEPSMWPSEGQLDLRIDLLASLPCSPEDDPLGVHPEASLRVIVGREVRRHPSNMAWALPGSTELWSIWRGAPQHESIQAPQRDPTARGRCLRGSPAGLGRGWLL